MRHFGGMVFSLKGLVVTPLVRTEPLIFRWEEVTQARQAVDNKERSKYFLPIAQTVLKEVVILLSRKGSPQGRWNGFVIRLDVPVEILNRKD
jgi:hypothetical protein